MTIALGHFLRKAVDHGANRVTYVVTDSADARCLRVADNGNGISTGNATRVFDPFFTNRRDKGGTGMGLSMVRNILQTHHATIALAPSQQGAAFQIGFQQTLD